MLMRHNVTVEIEGEDKPALTADVARPDVHLRRIKMAIRDAVIVSTARTADRQGLSRRVQRDALADPRRPSRSAPRSSAPEVDPAEIDDVIMGAALQQGVQTTIGRTAALRAGLPVTVAGMSIDRQCASGLMAIATAAKQVIVDRMDVVRRRRRRKHPPGPDRRDAPRRRPRAARACTTDVYMPMIDTAEMVGKRYGISRERAGRICAPVACKDDGRRFSRGPRARVKDQRNNSPRRRGI